MIRDYATALQNQDIDTIETYILESIGIKHTITRAGGFNVINGKILENNNDAQYVCTSFYNLANEERRKGNFEFACTLYKKGIEYYFYPSAVSNMALTLKQMGKISESIATYDELLEKQPDYIAGYLRLIKIAVANNIKPKYEMKHYFSSYFNNGGTKEEVEYYVSDPQALTTEREGLKQAYQDFLKI